MTTGDAGFEDPDTALGRRVNGLLGGDLGPQDAERFWSIFRIGAKALGEKPELLGTFAPGAAAGSDPWRVDNIQKPLFEATPEDSEQVILPEAPPDCGGPVLSSGDVRVEIWVRR
ncbi:hypothetical protein [Actinoplanes sp. NPDC051851]|uniref:hypothetical protein n=1 Tax=Actinoplanes sp. NPDC051851 TaxID=3154753 RepID=UPI003420889F